MLRRALLTISGRRSFSKSNCKSTDKSKPAEMPKESAQPTESSDFTSTVAPTEFDKKILIWSGKFKNKESIPQRIGLKTLHNAQSRMRIKVANLLMVGILALCGIFAYIGKSKVKSGETLLNLQLERERKILDEAKKEKMKQE